MPTAHQQPGDAFTTSEFQRLARARGFGESKVELRRGTIVKKDAPPRFTNQEFERLVRSGGFGDLRVELRQGMICKMSPEYASHANVKWLLAKAIEVGLASAGFGWAVRTEVSVDFGDGFEPVPDILVWDTELAPLDFHGPIPAAAVRLVVEVASTTLADDIGEKLQEYAAGGLVEYWVADIAKRLILRHSEPYGRTYARRQPSAFGEAFASAAHPSFQVDTASLA